jgi:hypothetical protein
MERTTNEEVRRLLEEIRKRQSRWLDQMVAGEGMLETFVEGRMLGERGSEGREKRVPGWDEERKDI